MSEPDHPGGTGGRPGPAGSRAATPPASSPGEAIANAAPARASGITVEALLADERLGIELTVLAGGSGTGRTILYPRIQKSGLALAGHFHGIVPGRIQVLGQTELSYLQRLRPEDRKRSLRGFFGLGLSCVVITQGSRGFAGDASGEGVLPVPELLEAADDAGTPILLSPERSSVTITALHALLDDRLAPRTTLHGVLVDVYGVGLLLRGASGIGKSECALDLVRRGHRLVADDVVHCDFRPPGMVFGEPAELLRHHLEVRGIGVLDVRELFGVAAIRERKRIDVVVTLVEWSRDREIDRLGIDERYVAILGVDIRELVIPVQAGRDMASLVEVAARNELLKNAGHHAAREFFERLEGSLLSERGRGETPAPPGARSRPPPPPPGSRPRAPMPRAPESSANIPKPRLR